MKTAFKHVLGEFPETEIAVHAAGVVSLTLPEHKIVIVTPSEMRSIPEMEKRSYLLRKVRERWALNQA